MAKKRRKHDASAEVPELPEARPMPAEANPGGTEGVNAGWAGGQSNVGEVLNPASEGDTTYSTSDVDGFPRTDVVARFQCDDCGQAFATYEQLNVHKRTTHRTQR
jgi:Zinc finger, C2H2 type